MELYLRTRGDALNQGYRWLRLDLEQSMPRSMHEPLVAQKPEASRLVYAEDFSVLLARAGSILMLQVTGLPVTEQSQRQRRNVQNVLVCVGQAPSDEPVVRGVLIAALEERLAAVVDAHISMLPAEPGFQVDWSALMQALMDMRTGPGRRAPSTRRVEPDTEATRQQLCDELRTYCLPDHSPYPVVVTRHRTPALLAHARVWRGLTSQNAAATLPVTATPPYFPSITVANRAGERLFIPDQFVAGLNFVILGRHLHHRVQGQRWLDQVEPLLAHSTVQLYILLFTTSFADSTIKGMLTHVSLARRVILVEQQQQQEHILEALHLRRLDTLTLLLVDRAGRVLWQGQGDYDEAQGARLQARLAELSARV